MIRIKTPATSANLGVGFDSFGLAINLYNTYSVKESSSYQVEGFPEVFNHLENDFIKAYKLFSKEHIDESSIKPVHVILEKQNIPVSRGLGSSASVYLGGIIAANEINQLNRSLEECAAFASELEGHPDNAFACAFGYFTASVQTDSTYIHDTFAISNNLFLYVLIPEVKGSTKELRAKLPNSVSLQDAVFHLSRSVHVPKALKEGNMVKLKQLLQDKLHEQYRYPSIPNYNEIKQLKDKDIVVTISGSGPSILIMANRTLEDELKHIKNFKVVQVEPSSGVSIEVTE
jgi:homoserine kinase